MKGFGIYAEGSGGRPSFGVLGFLFPSSRRVAAVKVRGAVSWCLAAGSRSPGGCFARSLSRVSTAVCSEPAWFQADEPGCQP